MLATIVDDALLQGEELVDLDAPRAEAWASDLLALVDELDDDDAEARLVAALAAAGTDASAAALHAIGGIAPSLLDGVEIVGAQPGWVAALGTSACDGAWVLRARSGVSAVFRFVDRDDVRHVVAVDLVAGPPEQIGEVTVGSADLLDALEEDDAEIDVEEVVAAAVADRVIAAMTATERFSPSAVVNGRLLVARLAPFAEGPLAVPVAGPDEIPDLPPRDPDDDAYARDVLVRALGTRRDPDAGGVAVAAAALRAAAASDAPVAQWLAASRGPVDLDGADLDVVLATLAAAIAPASLAPLAPDAREAVLVLEWADWLGAVLGVVRAGAGADAGPEALVDQVNRCPEVTTSIPKGDRDRVAWAFSVCTEAWAELGLVVDSALTELGAALLPMALERAWAA